MIKIDESFDLQISNHCGADEQQFKVPKHSRKFQFKVFYVVGL